MAQQSIYAAGTALDAASAAVGVGLSHPIRVAILRLLAERDELCSCEIEPLFVLDPSGVSRHLAALRDAGLITSRRDGVRILHRLSSERVSHLLAAVDSVAAGAEEADREMRQRRQSEYRLEVSRRGAL